MFRLALAALVLSLLPPLASAAAGDDGARRLPVATVRAQNRGLSWARESNRRPANATASRNEASDWRAQQERDAREAAANRTAHSNSDRTIAERRAYNARPSNLAALRGDRENTLAAQKAERAERAAALARQMRMRASSPQYHQPNVTQRLADQKASAAQRLRTQGVGRGVYAAKSSVKDMRLRNARKSTPAGMRR